MTTRSLGTLTLDLIAKIGGFESGMDKAARTADRKGREISKAARESAKATEEAWGKVGTVVGTVLASFAGGAVFQKFIGETRQAEQEQAQLAAVVKSTGEAAGFTVAKLNDMAESMAKASTFGAGDINQAQARLLSYTGVVGEQFPKAMQAAVDMAVRMGMTVPQAAEAVGKALDSPKDGLSALSKQGFRFTEDQKALVEQLQETGRTSEAQGIILAALESSYGGAAQAARDTFGGSLSALQETINDLLTGDSGSMAKMKASVEGLNATLGSEETRAAFQQFTGWLADATAGVVRAAAELATGAEAADGFINAILTFGTINPFRSVEDNIKSLREELQGLEEDRKRYVRAGSETSGLDAAIANSRLKLQHLERARNTALDAENSFLLNNYKSRAPAEQPTKAMDATGAAARAEAAKKAAKDKEAADKKALADTKRIFEQGQSYIQQLNEQVAKVEELSTVEKILFDLQLGKVTLTHAQKDEAFRLGQQIDDTKKLNEQKQADLNLVMAGITAQRELNDQVDQYNRAIAGLGLGNRARDKDAGRNQIDDKYAQDRRRLDDARREAMNNGKFDDAAKQRYDDELALIDDFKAKALVSYEDYWARLTAGEADWKNGASEALHNYLDQSRNVAAQTGAMWTNGMQGMEDALVKFATTGKLSFSDLARSIIADMVRIQARAAMSSVLTSLFGAWMGGASAASGGATGAGSVMGDLARDGVFWDGGYTGAGGKHEPAGVVHKGEVVWSQADVRKAGGVGVVEAMRLGKPGLANGGVVGAYTALPQGGESTGVVVNIHNNNKSEVKQTSRRSNGMDVIDIFIDQAVAKAAGQLATDSGVMGQAMRTRAKMGMS